MAGKDWTFITEHGVVFAYVMENPTHSVSEIAESLGLSQRAVARILRDLRDDHYITVRRRGGTLFFDVNSSLPMRFPSRTHHSVGEFFATVNRAGSSTFK